MANDPRWQEYQNRQSDANWAHLINTYRTTADLHEKAEAARQLTSLGVLNPERGTTARSMHVSEFYDLYKAVLDMNIAGRAGLVSSGLPPTPIQTGYEEYRADYKLQDVVSDSTLDDGARIAAFQQNEYLKQTRREFGRDAPVKPQGGLHTTLDQWAPLLGNGSSGESLDQLGAEIARTLNDPRTSALEKGANKYLLGKAKAFDRDRTEGIIRSGGRLQGIDTSGILRTLDRDVTAYCRDGMAQIERQHPELRRGPDLRL